MKREPEALFNDITQFIDNSHEALKEGAIMRLQGLDDQIRSLCEEVMQLSEAERMQYADRLKALLDELQQLGDTMTELRDKLAGDIRSLSSHQKANIAYRIVETSDKKKENN